MAGRPHAFVSILGKLVDELGVEGLASECGVGVSTVKRWDRNGKITSGAAIKVVEKLLRRHGLLKEASGILAGSGHGSVKKP